MDRELIELYKQLEEMSNQYTVHPTDTTHKCVCDIQSRIIDILNRRGI